MSYFTRYPSLISRYLLDPTQEVELKNLFRRLKIRETILSNKQNYINYYNVNSLRPEQISYEIYGDTQYWWVILLANNIINVDVEWSKKSDELENYISKKYINPNAIAHYKTKEIKDSNNRIVLPEGLIVQSNYTSTHDNITYSGDSVRTPVTYTELEIEKNEQKKSIKILKKSAIAVIEQEFDRLIAYQSVNNLDISGSVRWET